MYGGTCLKRPPIGLNLLAALHRWSYYAGSTEFKRHLHVRPQEVATLGKWLQVATSTGNLTNEYPYLKRE